MFRRIVDRRAASLNMSGQTGKMTHGRRHNVNVGPPPISLPRRFYAEVTKKTEENSETRVITSPRKYTIRNKITNKEVGI